MQGYCDPSSGPPLGLQRPLGTHTVIASQIGGLHHGVASSERLVRALAHLLRNAVKYVGDAGPGVSEEYPGQLFGPFFRPKPLSGREPGEAGLGSAVVSNRHRNLQRNCLCPQSQTRWVCGYHCLERVISRCQGQARRSGGLTAPKKWGKSSRQGKSAREEKEKTPWD